MLWLCWTNKIYENYKFFIKLPQINYRSLIHNIYILFFLNSYKGYRHIFGLPVSGQRTWSNAKVAKKLNTILILFKEKKLLKYLKNKKFKSFIYLTEYINYLYKYMWYHDWFLNKVHFIKIFRRSRYIKPKFYSLHIKYRKITSFSRSFLKKQKKKKHNKRKIKIDNNSFSIGFKFGYMVNFSQYVNVIYGLK